MKLLHHILKLQLCYFGILFFCAISCTCQNKKNVQIKLSKPSVILSNGKHNAFPSIEKSKKNRLLIGYRSSDSHLSANAKACLIYSDDWGQNWSQENVIDNGADFQNSKYGIRNLHITQLRKTLIATFHVNDGDHGDIYYFLSKNQGDNWSKREKLFFENFNRNKISCEGHIQEYGKQKVLPVFYGNENKSLDVGVAISKNFDSWEVFTVPSQNSKEAENILVKAGSDLLMFYSNPSKSKLFRTLSKDKGKTWAFPEEVTFPGWIVHRPNVFYHKKSGTLLLVYREGKAQSGALAISNDKGKTWNKIKSINDDKRRITYGDFVKIDENRIGFVYSTEDKLNGHIANLYYSEINFFY
ncbi:MAG: sialidase family protein [Bacteroidota bacterium]